MATSTPKPSSSMRDELSPVPNSTRPPETWSSVAIRSARRAGCTNSGGTHTIPWPMRILDVRAAAAASHTSEADESAWSSRKWCSTPQMQWKPSASPSSTCSSVSRNIRVTSSSACGNGSWIS